MNTAESRFLALEPDDAFAQRVLDYKEQVRRLVGDQLYLDHPPHLTLYLGVFPAKKDLVGLIGDLCRRLAAPTVTIDGWHVFEADQLTGNHTLVCNVRPDTRAALHHLQHEAVAAVAPHRDLQTTRACYDESWRQLSPDSQASVDRFGFPFVGPIWHPHVTVASVRPEDWQPVWSALADAPPKATVRFPHLSLFTVRSGQPSLIRRFAMEDHA